MSSSVVWDKYLQFLHGQSGNNRQVLPIDTVKSAWRHEIGRDKHKIPLGWDVTVVEQIAWGIGNQNS